MFLPPICLQETENQASSQTVSSTAGEHPICCHEPSPFPFGNVHAPPSVQPLQGPLNSGHNCLSSGPSLALICACSVLYSVLLGAALSPRQKWKCVSPTLHLPPSLFPSPLKASLGSQDITQTLLQFTSLWVVFPICL